MGAAKFRPVPIAQTAYTPERLPVRTTKELLGIPLQWIEECLGRGSHPGRAMGVIVMRGCYAPDTCNT